jgi:F0F1-type ATP synthase delta subunit
LLGTERQHMRNAGDPMFVRLDAIKEVLGEHSKMIRDIYKNPEIKAEEKRQLIDSLYHNMVEVAKGGKQMIRDSKAEAAPQSPTNAWSE